MKSAIKTLTRAQLEALCEEQQHNIVLLKCKVEQLEGKDGKTRRRWSQADLNHITTMFRQGASVADVALFFAVEMNAIYSICQRKQIRIRMLQHQARHQSQNLTPLKLVVNG